MDNPVRSALPANVDAERAVLGAILSDNASLAQVGPLCVDDFSLDSYRKAYRCMVEMAEDLRPIDIITLGDELARRGQLDEIGGHAFLCSLTEDARLCPSPVLPITAQSCGGRPPSGTLSAGQNRYNSTR